MSANEHSPKKHHTHDDLSCHSIIDTLKASKPGTLIMNHLASVDFVIKNGNAGCALRECSDFRANFCRLYLKSERCIGLPHPLPKVVAFLNLAGVRQVVYTQNINIVMLLVITTPEATERIQRGVNAVFKKAHEKNLSLAFYMSQPWQGGPDSLYWELRTVQRTIDAKTGQVYVKDGGVAFNSSSNEAKLVSNTLDTDYEDPDVKTAQMDTFMKMFSAADLDLSAQISPSSYSCEDQQTSDRVNKLDEICRVLQKERSKLIKEIEDMKVDFENRLYAQKHEGDVRVAKVAAASKKVEEVSMAKMAEMDAHHVEAVKQVNDLTIANKTLISQKAEMELIFETERQTLQRRAEIAEMCLSKERKHASSVENARKLSSEKLASANSRTMEEMERRLQIMSMERERAIDRAESLELVKQRQSEVIEIVQNEKKALEHEAFTHCKVQTRIWRGLVALFAIRYDEQQQELLALQHKVDNTEKAATVSTESVSVQTDILKETLENGELNMQVVQMKDEIGRLQKEVARFKADSPSKMVEHPNRNNGGSEHQACSTSTVVNRVSQVFMQNHQTDRAFCSYNHNGVSTNLGCDPHGDPATEALISQASSAFRTLADLSRECAWHKNAAQEGWAKYNALCASMQNTQNNGSSFGDSAVHPYYSGPYFHPQHHNVDPYYSMENSEWHGGICSGSSSSQARRASWNARRK